MLIVYSWCRERTSYQYECSDSAHRHTLNLAGLRIILGVCETIDILVCHESAKLPNGDQACLLAL